MTPRGRPGAADYVITGGGSAGCVLANRLSADPDVQVVLLEAGPRDRHPLIRVPAGITALMRSRRYNWAYRTVPQAQLDGRRLFWPRGRTLGGSSAINAMCYTRGHPTDYDAWERLGAEGWNWNALLPYFRRSERFHGGADAFHGGDGPLSVEPLQALNPFSEAFIEAARAVGHRYNGDFNGAEQAGAGPYHVMQERGRRCSNARAYLRPVLGRANLTVITGAHVHSLLLDGRRVTGVRYARGRHRYTVYAHREVLLAAGAVNTPQLLQLSGIGPARALEAAGVGVRHDLPGVGENLQDHLDMGVVWTTRDRRGISFHPSALPRAGRAAMAYWRHGASELSSNLAEAGAFVNAPGSTGPPAFQMHFLPVIEDDHGLDLRRVLRGYGYTLRTCLLRPESRGRIGLASADPAAAPRIDPNYLAASADRERMVEAVEAARAILHAAPLRRIGERETDPGAAIRDRAGLLRAIAARAETIYHPVGTCRIGRDGDSVVDPDLRVHGLDGVRVVDASVFPRIIAGNTNAPVTAVAERAAALIRGETSTGDEGASRHARARDSVRNGA